MLILVDPERKAPLYRQIYQEIKNKILANELSPGCRLPSTRFLANTLAVSRNTVESAYLQLTVEGYLMSRPGSGYIVQEIFDCIASANGNEPQPVNDAAVKERDFHANEQVYRYNFEAGRVNSADFPAALWKKTLNKALAELTANHLTAYGNNKGEPGLRSAIANYLKKYRGVTCDCDQIIVFAGTAQGLFALSRMLKPYYQDFAIEDPGFLIAREIFRQNGYKIVPIPVEKDGLHISQLEDSSSRIVYVTPSHQFPGGAVMSIRKRNQLLNWAERKDGIIIEDDYDSELRYHSKPIPSIGSTGTGANVIYLGTLSKVLSPSLRISYIVLPKRFMPLYDAQYGIYPASVSAIEQKTLELFMDSDKWEGHLRKMCAANKKRHDILVRAVKEILEDRVIIRGENAGLHIVLESAIGLSEQSMIEKAKRKSVLIYPVSPFCFNPGNYSNNMALLGFGNMSEADIVDGIEMLRQGWDV